MSTQTAIARAHTNIALVKYWGKKDQKLIIPFNNSISLTLAPFYTDTKVTFDEALIADQLIINGQLQTSMATQRVHNFLDIVRQMAGIPTFAKVTTINHVATAAGLASSASGFAALALAASRAAGLHLTKSALSRLARRGSGSACRSIYGGLVEWQRGSDDLTSLAVPIEEQIDWGLQMIAIVLDSHTKKISSRNGMANTVATSPYYDAWVKVANDDARKMRAAIAAHDINQIGIIAQNNALKMHATTMAANPGFTYLQPQTLKTMQIITNLQQQGLTCYYTMDAGPNVKVICDKAQTNLLLHELRKYFNEQQLLVARPGVGAHLIDALG
ncbi:MAG: diphosphomevalonate decarboxylase [Candidatus Paralactobacillus gallistercoris]|uniref:diphosphomevalonate decarboxylase n=1 Tax=Candidatus Paralactobacillus gallistercoris TaxID=2838724 RepID=A0A948TJW3_9LACO|nr:diphosphomevalonate decarboxylase [Candidatus Paralactobacillus gallistercoris]